MTTRAEVVREAREWVGTAYQHQQRAKGVAVDCAGLVIGVARALVLVPPDFDVTGYARQPDGVSLLAHCDRWMVRLHEAEMQAGDVIVMRFESDPCHFAILGDHRAGLSMIHALRTRDGGGRVIEHRLAPHHLQQLVAVYQLPGVA
jgi:NlpC/P60 family putative phage cell wall peptidase